MSEPQSPNRSFISDGLADVRSRSAGENTMLDVIYLALGLGLFALMGLYARWATRA
jgi:hypothetical protein